MPHYRDGTPAKIGDVVKGRGYNVPHEIIGKVVNVREGDSCTLSVAYVGENCPLIAPLGTDPAMPHSGVRAQADIEYGDTKGFEKIA